MAANLSEPRGTCPNCGTENVPLLSRDHLLSLSHTFFVRGSIVRADYGAAPKIQFNELQSGSINPQGALAADVDLLQRTLGVGFFTTGLDFGCWATSRR